MPARLCCAIGSKGCDVPLIL
ncbi:MAG: hypothetical protein QOG47_2841, partial [Mycobacterium sp.]|nr:hypothetical protein [Mycobacterium sp.]